MARIKISIEVDAEIYKKFRVALDANMEKAPKILTCAMNSYAEGVIIQQGLYLVGSEEESKGPGRPTGSGKKKEKEPVKVSAVPYKFEKGVDVWDQDYTNATYADIPVRRWEHKELAQTTYDWLDFQTEDKDGNPFEMFASFEYFNERPKYSEFDWLNGAYQEFLSRVASFFLLKNQMKSYGFSLKDVWNDALIQKDIWDKYLIAEGKLKETS